MSRRHHGGSGFLVGGDGGDPRPNIAGRLDLHIPTRTAVGVLTERLTTTGSAWVGRKVVSGGAFGVPERRMVCFVSVDVRISAGWTCI